MRLLAEPSVVLVPSVVVEAVSVVVVVVVVLGGSVVFEG